LGVNRKNPLHKFKGFLKCDLRIFCEKCGYAGKTGILTKHTGYLCLQLKPNKAGIY
jgi:hypothetical protein